MSICIVIPTYNEKGNLDILLKGIFSAVPEASVLIVDDNSPDGTGQAADQLTALYPNLTVLHRAAKQGLGPAYMAGFTKALAAGYKYIAQMDADLSHDPKYLPALIAAAASADVVLGSRYVTGGGVANWNWARRSISRFGNIYAQVILSLPYHDLTGGFKCYKAATLQKILDSNLSSLGYNFQIECTYRAHQHRATIVEVPIIFTERTVGKSKFNLKIMLEGFWRVVQLRFRNLP